MTFCPHFQKSANRKRIQSFTLSAISPWFSIEISTRWVIDLIVVWIELYSGVRPKTRVCSISNIVETKISWSINLDSHQWLDLIILFSLSIAFGCLSIIQIRKASKHGYLKAVGQDLDEFDKRLLKFSAGFLLIFIVLLCIRLRGWLL